MILYEKEKTIKSKSFSDVKNCALCLQNDPESFELVFSARSHDLLRKCEPHTQQKIATYILTVFRSRLCRLGNKSVLDALYELLLLLKVS